MKTFKTKITNQLNVPVLLLIFNRPNTTIKVFQKIVQAKPSKLYIAGDGPREGLAGEIEKVKKAREIVNKINRPCEIKTLFSEKNLGCKKGVSTAITWFFEQEERGIILEDDCVPHLDFFNYCENLLDYYSEDHRISVITGNNFQNGKLRGDASYYFSKYNHCWGWASWRRAWDYYQGDINFWPEWSNSKAWFDHIPDKVERKYWQKIFNLVYKKKIDSWAYPWLASIWYKNGLTVTPNVNLVSNIGFGLDATHTHNENDKNSNMKTKSLKILKHPKVVKKDLEADIWTFNHHYGGKNFRFPYKWIVFPIRILNFIYKKIKFYFKN